MMEDLLRVVFLLCAIAAPGHSLSCSTCAAKNSKCRGTSVTCPTGYSCGLAYRETTEDGITTTDYLRMCVPSQKCDNVGSISYSGGNMKMGVSCCKRDNCIPPLPKLPEERSEVNKLTCPTCRSTTSNSCNSQSDIKCTGNEQMCITQNTVTSVSKDSVMGCATRSVCDMKDLFYESERFKMAMTFTCNSGTNNAERRDAKDSLSCYKCATYDATCEGIRVTCPSDHSCGLVYREMTEGKQVFTDYIKSCVPKEDCNRVGRITHPNGNIKLGISCCDTDFCTPPLPQWPSGSSEANGLSCPGCRSYEEEFCKPTHNFPCYGNENTCALHSSRSPGFNDTAIGCASQGFCDMLWFSYNQPPTSIGIAVVCSNKIGKKTEIQGTPLSCVVCKSDDSLECTGKLEQCPVDHVCASAYRVIVSGRKYQFGIARSCVPKDKCNADGTMSVNTQTLIMGTSCCHEDGCTPVLKPPNIPVNAKLNGVKCETCTSMNSDSCKATGIMECRGDENQCVNYAIVVSEGSQSGSISMRGCGVRALCNIQKYSYILSNVKFENRFTCKS